jgi:hypothetical protein
MRPWTASGAGPRWTTVTVPDRGCWSAAARSPKYGLRWLRCTKAHRRGHNRERRARGARLGPHRSSGGGVEAGRRRWREEVTGNSVGRVSDTGEETRRVRLGVGCSRSHRGGFYRARGGHRGGGRSNGGVNSH